MSKPLLATMADEDIDPALLENIPDVGGRVSAPPSGDHPDVAVTDAPQLHDLFLRAQGEMNELVARELGRIERSLLTLHGTLEARLAQSQAENDGLRLQVAQLEERDARHGAALDRLKELAASLEESA